MKRMNKLPTINIKGKEYVMVKDRITAFHELYPKGSIQTKILSDHEDKVIIVRAMVVPDPIENPGRFFTGHASETIGEGMINKTSALENCETSAVGRALAFMGIGVVDSVASADEVHHAISKETDDRDPDWIKDFDNGSTKTACKFCGSVGKYHKKGCPNATT